MKLFIGLLFLTILFSCADNHEEKIKPSKPWKGLENVKSPVKLPHQVSILIKDTNLYSRTFTREVSNRLPDAEKITFSNDSIIVGNDKENPIILPTDLPLKKEIKYESADKKNILFVKRLNYTTIEYTFNEVIQNDTKVKKGLAYLEPAFFLGSEGTFEDTDGKTYGMNEYIDNSTKDCWMNILIGVGSINQSSLNYGCEGEGDAHISPVLFKK